MTALRLAVGPLMQQVNDEPSVPVTSGLVAHLDASDAATINQATTSGRVSSWVDKTGNLHGYSAGGATAEPVTGATTKNGRNVIDFNGTTHGMDTPVYLYALGACSIFVVHKTPTAASAGNVPFMGEGDAFTTQTLYCPLRATATAPRVLHEPFIRTDAASVRFNTTSTVDLADDVWGISAALDSGTNIECRRDGVSDGGTAYTRSGALTPTNSSIGRLMNGSYVHYQTSIAEILVYNRVVSSSEAGEIEDYLTAKWGL